MDSHTSSLDNPSTLSLMFPPSVWILRYSLPTNRTDIVLRTIACKLILSLSATESLICQMLGSSYGQSYFVPGQPVYTFPDVPPVGMDIPCRKRVSLFDVYVSDIPDLTWRTVPHINGIESNGLVVSFSMTSL
jgi:hypothetical protein